MQSVPVANNGLFEKKHSFLVNGLIYCHDCQYVAISCRLLYRIRTLSYSSVLDLGMELANEFNNSIEAQHDSLRMLRDWESDSRTRGNTRNVCLLT